MSLKSAIENNAAWVLASIALTVGGATAGIMSYYGGQNVQRLKAQHSAQLVSLEQALASVDLRVEDDSRIDIEELYVKRGEGQDIPPDSEYFRSAEIFADKDVDGLGFREMTYNEFLDLVWPSLAVPDGFVASYPVLIWSEEDAEFIEFGDSGILLFNGIVVEVLGSEDYGAFIQSSAAEFQVAGSILLEQKGLEHLISEFDSELERALSQAQSLLGMNDVGLFIANYMAMSAGLAASSGADFAVLSLDLKGPVGFSRTLSRFNRANPNVRRG